MSEIVERVARAIWDVEFDRIEIAHQCRGDEWELYIPHARAVIQAMREPTEAMLTADGNFSAAYKAAIWRAMIDAALKPDA